MNKAWRVILVIVVICIAVGAVSAGVGVLTGADFDRIGSAFKDAIAVRHNVDVSAFFREWVPQAIQVIHDASAQ
jgi:hypothetical protein